MPPRFGTDGIRGKAGTELTAELTLALGRAVARTMGASRILVGRDTRQSGPMLEAALAEGLSAEGSDVVLLEVIPTPGVAFLARERGLPAAVISASHNPYGDNGIKLLGPGGSKLSLAEEAAVEAELEAITEGRVGEAKTARIGTTSSDEKGLYDYAAHLCSIVEGSPLPSGEVVVDCANGAASTLAPYVFERLGLSHRVLHAEPDGININAGCGSTHLDSLVSEVTSRGASLGIAFDGDADRMLAVDENGHVVDGDQLIAMFAADLRASGRLAGMKVVATVMSNMGLRKALEAGGVSLVETPLGDRHVSDALEEGGYSLGGEQSGHIVFPAHSPTGDGVLTALKLLELLGKSGRALGELAASSMTRLPQVLRNVPAPDPARLATEEALVEAVDEVSRQLGGTGRVLVRPSGTEPVVRIMVEAATATEAEDAAKRLAGVLEALSGRDH